MCCGEKKDPSKDATPPPTDPLPDVPADPNAAPAEGGEAQPAEAKGTGSQEQKGTGSKAGKEASKVASTAAGQPSLGLTSKAGAKNAGPTTTTPVAQSQVGKAPSLALQTNAGKGGASKAVK